MKQEKIICPFCQKTVTVQLYNGKRVYNAHWFDKKSPFRYRCPKSQAGIKSDGTLSVGQ